MNGIEWLDAGEAEPYESSLSYFRILARDVNNVITVVESLSDARINIGAIDWLI